MSLEDITNAASEMNLLRQAFADFYATVDGDLAARQAAYDAMVANLKETIKDQVEFNINWTPNAVDSNPVHNGHVRSWAEVRAIFDASPVGALVTVYLDGGEHLIDAADNSKVLKRFIGNGASEMKFAVVQNGDKNDTLPINIFQKLRVENVDVTCGVEPFPGGNYSNTFSLFNNSSEVAGVEFASCTFSGPVPMLVSAYYGGHLHISANNSSIDTLKMLGSPSGLATASISAQNVTLTNGATLHGSEFVVGQNLLLAS